MKIRYALLALVAVVSILASGCGNKAQSANQPISAPAQAASTPAEQPAATTAAEPAATPVATPEAKPAAKPAKPSAKAGSWITTDSGLKYKDKKVGTGTEVKSGDKITVHYKGWLDDGTVFDTSMKEGREPFQFTVGVGEVIPGWDEGVAGMKVGGTRELTIPSGLAYRDQGQGPIPPNATLHFTVKVLAIAQ